MTVRRNAFGRQVDSFEETSCSTGSTVPYTRCSSARRGSSASAPACRCLRAPPTSRRGPPGRHLATAFHPEMTGDRRMHELFVDMLSDRR